MALSESPLVVGRSPVSQTQPGGEVPGQQPSEGGCSIMGASHHSPRLEGALDACPVPAFWTHQGGGR